MKQSLLLVASLLTTCVVSGCAATARGVPVKGKDTHIALLAGEWEGEYSVADAGRHGSIQFALEVGRHTAQGKVVMSSGGIREVAPLEIEFVEVEENMIRGRLEPYNDPMCGCAVEAEFVGTRSGDLIEGQFVIRGKEAKLERVGSWFVARKNQ